VIEEADFLRLPTFFGQARINTSSSKKLLFLQGLPVIQRSLREDKRESKKFLNAIL